MFSQTSEYALRAVVALAQGGGGPMSAAEIAHKTQVPADYLAKILQSLQRRGILHSKRGLNGGYSLVMSAEELSLLDVVNTVDPLKRITRCPLGIPEHSTKLCELHRRIDEALEHVESTFRSSTISMMIEEGSSPLPETSADVRP